jgi:poly(beta-D-mannuronate) lyase
MNSRRYETRRRYHLNSRALGAVPILCLSFVAHVPASETRVATVADLRTALVHALPGDKIIVANGVYENERPIDIAISGTKEQSIEISAESVGGVGIKGTAGFTFTGPAAYVVLRGFKFTHEAGTVRLAAATHHCRVTRNVFEMSVARNASYLAVSGDDHEIDHNTFQNKKSEGKMLEVMGPSGTAMAQRTWIHHNYFYNFENSHRNNSSALHIGHSARSLSSSHALVEHNLFVLTRGENEGAICNKASDNIYRYNTFGEGCTELSLRHGDRCLVYGNFFIGTHGGIRFFGDDHRIFSNYFERNHPAVQIGNGDGNVPPAKLTSHDRPDRAQFVFNTLVDNQPSVVMQRRKEGLGATQLVFANNIIKVDGRAVSIEGPLSGAGWEGNFICGDVREPGDIPAGGYATMEPQLRKTPGERYRLKPDCAAIGRAVGSYSYVDVDIDGQRRDGKLDVGADQVSTSPPANRILTSADVGPNAP